MRRRDNRIAVLALAGVGLVVALGLAALGLQDAVAFFRTPSELTDNPVEPGRAVSLGGLVEAGSVRHEDGAMIFRLVDDVGGVEVRYAGPVPDLFREGQCVIAQGVLEPSGVFIARRVLAKHDENYRPREVDAAPRLARSCGPAAGSGVREEGA